MSQENSEQQIKMLDELFEERKKEISSETYVRANQITTDREDGEQAKQKLIEIQKQNEELANNEHKGTESQINSSHSIHDITAQVLNSSFESNIANNSSVTKYDRKNDTTRHSNPNPKKPLPWKLVLGVIGAIVSLLLAATTAIVAANFFGVPVLAAAVAMLGKACSITGLVGLGAATAVCSTISFFAIKDGLKERNAAVNKRGLN